MKDEAATTARPVPVQFAITSTALVHAEPEAGGSSAEVPALPGCYTPGETLEEVQANLREAVEGRLASAHDEVIDRRGSMHGTEGTTAPAGV